MLKPLMIAAIYTANPNAQGAVAGLAAWNFDGNPRNFTTMFANIVGILMSSIVSICIAVFLTGAFLYIIGSFGKEDLKSNGKNMMIGSLIALLIVQLARAIVAVTLLFMYWGTL